MPKAARKTLPASSAASRADAFDDDRVRALALADAGFGVWQIALETDALACDAAAAKLLACEGRPDLHSRADLLERVHPDDRENVALRLDLCARTGASLRGRFRLDRPGATRWLEITGRRASGKNGAAMIVGTLRDVGVAMGLLEELQRSQTRFAAVFDQKMVGVLHSGLDRTVLMVNDRYLELVGRTAEEMEHLSFADFTHPDDLTWNAPLFEQKRASGEPFTVEKRYLRPDGSVIWCEVHVSFVPGDDGRPKSSIVFAHDITNRKLAEMEVERARDMLALALDGAGAGTWEVDLEQPDRLQLSPNAVRMYGLPDDHDGLLLFDEWARLVDEESLATINAAFETFKDPAKSHTAEFRIAGKDGACRWLRVQGRAVVDEAGKPQRIVGLVFDDSDRKHAEDELRESEELLRLSQEAARIGTFVTAPTGGTIGSAQFYRNLGLPEDTIWIDEEARRRLIHPDDAKRVLKEITAALRAGRDFYEGEYRIVRADNGETRWVLARVRLERDAKGELTRFVGAQLDITEAKIATLKLQEALSLNEGIVESSPDCIKLLDPDGTLRFMSRRGLQTMEVDDGSTILGTLWQDLWPEEALPAVEKALAEARAGKAARFNAGCITQKGNPMWLDVVVTPLRNEAGEVNQLLSITRDVTELRAQTERVRWVAEHDALTGLPNRNYFDEELRRILASAKAGSERVGLLALDVDNFKQVNDAFGHDTGDLLLRTLAGRLNGLLGEGDFAARLGGDEFAIVVRHVEEGRGLTEFGKLVHETMRQPIAHQGYILDCRVSIGGAVFPQDGATRDHLLKSADTALYAAKTAGRNNTLLFEKSMRSELDRRAAMIGMARSALERNDIVPFYQPKVVLRTGEIAGFEALLRWRDADGSVHPPAGIEAAFEDLELAHEISERMQDRIIEDMRGWIDAGLAVGPVAVNAAAAEFSRNDFAPRLLGKLDAARIPPHRLQVEVTETVFMGRGADHVGEAMRELKRRGVEIALDDFGTGYASLSHLKKFPVDVIKIDRSFITGLERDAGDTAIVCALLGLAADLDIAIVAEGIESAAQAAFLRERNCDFGQGYYFGRAVMADRVPALLAGPIARPTAAGDSRAAVERAG